MKIREVKITNFKNIPNYSLVPDRKLTILKGPSSSGKTTCIEAIAFAFGADSDYFERDLKNFISLDQNGCHQKFTSVTLMLENGSGNLENFTRKLYENGSEQFFFGDQLVNEKKYRERFQSFNLISDSRPIGIFNLLKTLPEENAQLEGFIRNLMGFNKKDNRLEMLEKELEEATEENDRCSKVQHKLKLAKRSLSEYYLLRLFQNHLNTEKKEEELNVIKNNKKKKQSGKAQKMATLRTEIACLKKQRLQFLLLAKANKIVLSLDEGSLNSLTGSPGESVPYHFTTDELMGGDRIVVDFSSAPDVLRMEPTDANFLEKYEELKIHMEKIQTDNFNIGADEPLLIEKIISLQAKKSMVRETIETLTAEIDQIQEEKEIQYEIFVSKVATSLSKLYKVLQPRKEGNAYLKISHSVTSSGKLEISVREDGSLTLLDDLSTGQIKLVQVALAFAIIGAMECPIVLHDEMDKHLFANSTAMLINLLLHQTQTQTSQMICSCNTQDFFHNAKQNKLSLIRLAFHD